MPRVAVPEREDPTTSRRRTTPLESWKGCYTFGPHNHRSPLSCLVLSIHTMYTAVMSFAADPAVACMELHLLSSGGFWSIWLHSSIFIFHFQFSGKLYALLSPFFSSLFSRLFLPGCWLLLARLCNAPGNGV